MKSETSRKKATSNVDRRGPSIGAVALMIAALCVSGQAVRSASAQARSQVDPNDPIDRAFQSMYSLDFAGAGKILDAQLAANPSDALAHSARGIGLLFAEFNRLQILELDFFGDDDVLTDKKRVSPDPAVRDRILAAAAEARRLADLTLKKSPYDRRALFAMTMAVTAEMEYAGIVEKRYVRSGSLSRESQALADRMLALNPPIYDAYVTLGSIEYVVGSLNPFYRIVAGLFGLRGDKALAADHLEIVMVKGRYYAPFAKMLRAVMYLRDGQLKQARSLMDELHREFPANTIYPREVARIDAKIAAGRR